MSTIPIRFRTPDFIRGFLTALAGVTLALSVTSILSYVFTTWPIIGATSTETETPSVVSTREIEALFPPQYSPVGTVRILAAMPGPNGATLYTVGLTNGESRTATSSSPGLKVGDAVKANVAVYYNNGQYNHTWIITTDAPLAATSRPEGYER